MSPITFLVYFIEGKNNYVDQSNEPSFHSWINPIRRMNRNEKSGNR